MLLNQEPVSNIAWVVIVELQEEDAPLTSLLDVLEEAQDAIDAGANAIVVMGGTNNKHITAESLISLLSALSDIAPVGIYSGSEDEERDKMIALEGHCTWLKTGPYVDAFGGLESTRTNQRFYRITPTYRLDAQDNLVDVRPCFLDETHKFWKKRVENVT